MNVDLQTLAIIGMLTTLATECVKSMCRLAKVDYVSNIIAAAIALILSFVIEIIKPVLINGSMLDGNIIYNFIVMAFFGMLTATLGFDKISQTVMKFKG